ncbi:restriction endonuclease subunit S, partial [Alcanivorax borkumensis]
VVDPSYLLFAYLSPDFQREIVARTNSGATVDRIALKELPSFPIRIPKLQEQREIASVLSALDNKIELNRQINATLESMAQALFKSWFVDFDPVIDNALAAGNPIPEPLQARAEKRAALLAASAADTRSPNATDNTHPTQTAPHTQSGTTAPATPLQPLPADLRALFPDSFVFNEEMGWVPAGWPSGLLDEIAHYGSERISVGEIGHANYVSTENLIPERGGVREASSLPTSEWVPAFTDGSILVSNIRPYFKKIWMARRVGGRSNDVLGFESRLAGAEEYLYCLLCQDKFFDYMMATAKGTKMPRGDKKAIMNWQVVIPSDQLMREFSSIIRGFLLSAQARSEQSLSLASIRDSILPRLLRGEIRIEDVHQSLAEVV